MLNEIVSLEANPFKKRCTFFSNLSPLWCLLFSHDVIFVTKRESQTLSTHTKWDTTKTATFLLFCTIQRFKAETFKLLDWHTIKLWPCCFFLWKKKYQTLMWRMTWHDERYIWRHVWQKLVGIHIDKESGTSIYKRICPYNNPWGFP